MSQPNLADFKFSHPIQMRWTDLDPLGHVNNGIFVTYFEIARGGFMMTAVPKWDWTKDMFLIGNVNVNFHKELLLTSQDARVHIKTAKLGSKSFVLEYVVTSKKGDERVIHASGTTTQIMFDTKSRSTIEIPDWVRNSMTEYDGLEG